MMRTPGRNPLVRIVTDNDGNEPLPEELVGRFRACLPKFRCGGIKLALRTTREEMGAQKPISVEINRHNAHNPIDN
jgi:hypothetical protein